MCKPLELIALGAFNFNLKRKNMSKPTVEEIRSRLKQDHIELDEPTHTYNIRTHGHLKFESVTSFIGEFFEPFDAEGVSAKLAANNTGRYANMDQDQILKKWDEIAERGTDVHLEVENWCWAWMDSDKPQDNEIGFEVEHTKAQHGINWLKDILEPQMMLFPEVRLFSPKLQLAGTLDLLIYEPNKDMWVIADWKTNRKISTSGFMGKKGIKNATRLLQDCKYTRYGLQMSMYQWILENENEYNFENIIKRVLVHLRPKPTRMYPLGVKEFFTPYLKPNIEKMVEYRLQQKERGELFTHLV